jgi:hypothetical protein
VTTLTPMKSERSELESVVDINRAELVDAVRGLTEEQARRRLVPSLTTPLALLKHAAFVERVWFAHRVDGRTRAEVGIAEEIDPSFLPAAEDTVESLIADFEAAAAESRRIAAEHDLDETFAARHGQVTLRWIYLHMIEELARHAGHADILREQLLAADETTFA